MEKELVRLYENAVDYIGEDNTLSQKEIIEDACRVLADYDEFQSLYEKCCNHINGWNENTLEEQEVEGYCIVEEISGELGEYFDD